MNGKEKFSKAMESSKPKNKVFGACMKEVKHKNYKM